MSHWDVKKYSSVSEWSGSGIILIRKNWRQASYIVLRAGTIRPTRAMRK